MINKQRIFIASSRESLNIAKALQTLLDHTHDATVWSQDIFTAARGSFESIHRAVLDHSYGVFVFGPDDVVLNRDKQVFAPRLNVVLEMGYFAGVHGMHRTFYLQPKNGMVQTLSDLAGITPVEFDLERFQRDGAPALGAAATAIELAIARDRITYPVSRFRRPNILAPEVSSVDTYSTSKGDGYCLAAKLGGGQSVKVTLAGEFDNSADNIFAWTMQLTAINSGWDRLPPLGIVDGKQALYAEGPIDAFLPIGFSNAVKRLQVEVFENGEEEPVVTKIIEMHPHG